MTAPIIEALSAVLEAHPLPKAWSNAGYDPKAPGAVPYIAVSFVLPPATDATMDSSAPVISGRLIATLVRRPGNAPDENPLAGHRQAASIAALFHRGQRITGGAQVITITDHPSIGEGYEDGAYWRVPVRVSFTAA